MLKPNTLLALVALLSASSITTQAGDWPRWRGPAYDDRSTDTGLLKTWPAEGPKRLWVNEDAGLGYAGFAVVGGTLYTMGSRDAVEYVIAIDTATGKEKWSAEAGALYKNGWGDGPRSTPTVDGDKIFAMSGKGTLSCINAADGKVVWQVKMVEDLGGKLQNWGYTESPFTDEKAVYCTPGGAKGTIAALDKATGKVLWQTSELTDVAQYSSMIAIDWNGSRQLVQQTGKTIVGLAPADGKILWRTEFPGKTAVIPTPIFSQGQVFVAAGYGVGCKSVQLGTGNSVTDLYSNTNMVNHHGGVILHEGNLFGFSDGGGWTCMDLKTGTVKWADKKAFGKGAIHYADGMFYLLEENSGNVALIEASSTGYSEKGRFKLDPQTTRRSPQGKVWVHPVVANGRLYLRDQELLHCYDVSGK